MAIHATMQWMYQSGGNAANGGGFDPTSGTPGTNYAWGVGQTVITYTDIETDGANLNVMCSVGRAFTSADVGNIINVTGGTHATAGRYQILSVAGGKATVDRNWATEDNTDHNDGAGKLGGALDVPTDALLELCQAGNKVWISGGGTDPGTSYTIAAALTITAAGTAVLPIVIEGYASTPGDLPKGSTRPTINMGANGCTLGAYWHVRSCKFTGTSATVCIFGTAGLAEYCASNNTSTTANRNAWGVVYVGTRFIGCEGQAIVGRAWNYASGGCSLEGCYAHDSAIGLNVGGNNVIASNVITETCTTGVALGATYGHSIDNCTIRNCTTGISASTAYGGVVTNTSITGCVTGASWTTATPGNYWNWNNFYNNTTDRTNVTAGANDIGVDPGFTSGMVSGTTATIGGTGNKVLTDAGKNFTTLGVVAGDYVVIHSGTGATAGVYLIDTVGTTTITLNTTPGASGAGDVVYGIVLGGTSSNFAVGANLKAQGYPGAFPGCGTTGYTDIGAVQRQEPAASGGGGGSVGIKTGGQL